MSGVVVVCGSTAWHDFRAIYERLRRLPRGTTVRHGKARGADNLAGLAARKLGFPEDPMPADWKVTDDTPPARIRRRRDGTPYDVAAGNVRNIAMLDKEPVPWRVLAFQLNGSSGTQHCIDEARKRGIMVEVERRWK